MTSVQTGEAQAADRRGLTRRRFLAGLAAGGAMALCAGTAAAAQAAPAKRPNILFAIADDWSWPHASVLGAPELSTPAFDRVAREGMLFHNAFTAAPQCSPNRAATLTGRNIWQLEEAGTHASIFPGKFAVYPDLLEASGYHVGYTGKGWGPGDWQRGGWKRNPAGPEYNKRALDTVPYSGIHKNDAPGNFDDFLADRPQGAPFCFWFGSNEPHRVYEEGSGITSGKDPARVTVPGFLPDDPVVRSDMLDYFVEVEWFDRQLGAILKRLEALGELDNTVVVVTGDNGMPFPCAKANVYEYGTHAPLAIRWGGGVAPGQETRALVSFIDFAPTFLDLAGVPVPEAMTGKSFAPVLKSPQAITNDFVLTGRERHTHARYDNLGYPARAIRTADYLYVRNFKPERWPMGDPDQYYDIDDGPSKRLVLAQREKYPRYFEAAVGKRPSEELFAIPADAYCMHNLAYDPAHAQVRAGLAARLDELLAQQKDPRALGYGDIFESYPRVSAMRPQLGGFAQRGEYNPKYQVKP